MNLYDVNLKYAMDEMLLYAYDFDPLKEQIFDLMEEGNVLPYQLNIELLATPPSIESPLIQQAYRDGKLKSYMKKEAVQKIYDNLKLALNSNFNSAIQRFTKLRGKIDIKVKTHPDKFLLCFHFSDLPSLTRKMVYAIISHYQIDAFGFCDSVAVKILVIQNEGESINLVYEIELPKVSLVDYAHFLTTDSAEILEFYQCPEVMEILFSHFFPYGHEAGVRTEITFDILKDNTLPQKRRKVSLADGDFEAFHNVLTQYTTHQEFVEIVKNNHILDFYPSVRAAQTGEMVACLIDIDCSTYLKQTFSPKLLWEFTINLTEEFIRVLTQEFGLPSPLIIFSGNRGVHLLYKLARNCVEPEYGYLNYWEVYLLPSQKSLLRDKGSLIHNKFTFVRTLVESVILYTIKNMKREVIPEQIWKGLGIVNIFDLFTLSPFSDLNKIGILLDTSSNNASVHRIFSIHPRSALVSIPITDPKTGLISEHFKDFETLREEAKISRVVDNLQKGLKANYNQLPPELNRKHIRSLLQPNTLLPILGILVKFSDRWTTERSPYSYQFWFDFYELTTFYEYIGKLLLTINRNDKDIGKTYQSISKIISTSHIATRDFVQRVVDEFFFQNVNQNTTMTRLNGFKDIEFFYRFKYDEIMPLGAHRVDDMMFNDRERKNFLRKFRTFFNMVQIIIYHYLKENMKVSSRTTKAINSYYTRLTLLKKEVSALPIRNQGDQVLQMKLDLVKIACLHNIFALFLREIFFARRLRWRRH